MQRNNYYNKRYDSLFEGSAVGILGGVSGPLCRSVISKTVPLEDIGMFHGSDLILFLYFVATAKLQCFISFPVFVNKQMKTGYLLSVVWFDFLYC